MRVPTAWLAAAGVLGGTIADAQTPGPQAGSAGADFSGVYTAAYVSGAPAIRMPDSFPFTAEGGRAHAAYDPLVSSARVVADCAPEIMPALLWTTNPMQINQTAERIVFRYEEADTIRSIPWSAAPAADARPPSALGSSVASWVDGALVIETTHLMAGVMTHGRGYPVSGQARLTERYWREPGQTDLQMTLVVDDPVNYTEPVTLGRTWLWSADERVRAWHCISLGARGSEPDIEALAEALEAL